MPIVHLTARMRPPHALFWRHEHAQWFWERIRSSFAPVLALQLMPNHPHLLVGVADVVAARHRLARICGHLQRRARVDDLWEPIPGAEVITDRQKLRRSVRYVALNACRAGLATGPLAWLWSTHRDVVGAATRPMIEARRLRRIFGGPSGSFMSRLHQFTSADPSVRVEGTPLPVPAPVRGVPEVPLALVARAAAMATRCSVEAIGRRGEVRTLFVALAKHQGWHDAKVVADACGLRPHAVRDAWSVESPQLPAAAVCLGDPRLLYPDSERPNQRETLVRGR